MMITYATKRFISLIIAIAFGFAFVVYTADTNSTFNDSEYTPPTLSTTETIIYTQPVETIPESTAYTAEESVEVITEPVETTEETTEPVETTEETTQLTEIVEETTEPVEEEKILTYKYGRRMTPAVDIDIPGDYESARNYTEEVDTSNYEYIGTRYITGYTPMCGHCCSGTGLTSSGVYAINGYTVATSSDLPFGTTLYIEGYGYYVVEDRGPGSSIIDISAATHDECYELTSSEGVRVYIVPHN